MVTAEVFTRKEKEIKDLEGGQAGDDSVGKILTCKYEDLILYSWHPCKTLGAGGMHQ